MPHVMIPLATGTPIIDLYVGVSDQRRSALQKAGQPIPTFQIARALIDTGASCTCIDPGILNPLGLTATGTVAIHTPSTAAGATHSCDQFDVALGIYHPTDPMLLTTVPVIATNLAHQGIQALLGRDVLRRCLLIFDGMNATMTLAF